MISACFCQTRLYQKNAVFQSMFRYLIKVNRIRIFYLGKCAKRPAYAGLPVIPEKSGAKLPTPRNP
ncbi:hypothetical protein BDI4_1040022 [Burkholderia diffusa]|nr:hypothetical protein BDI4_1040022 [Burkholderia diffusa]